MTAFQYLLNCCDNLANLKRPPLHLIESDRLDGESGPKNDVELPTVQLSHQDPLEGPEHISDIGRQRVEVTEV